MSETPDVTGDVALVSVLDVRAADPLKTQLLSMRGRPVRVDPSCVERLGGLCLQVLLSAVQTWRSDGQSLTFINVSDALREQWQSFGAPLNDLEAQDVTA